MQIMNIFQVSLAEFRKEEMLNKLRENHTNYQFFIVFWEPFANTFLLEKNKLVFFDPKNQQSNRAIMIQCSPLYLLGA